MLSTYARLEQLDVKPPFIQEGRYHLYTDGKWMYSFSFPDVLAAYYLKFLEAGYAVTVLWGHEVAFYAPKQQPFRVRAPKKRAEAL